MRHRDFDYRYEALVKGAGRGAWITDGLAGATDFHILSVRATTSPQTPT